GRVLERNRSLATDVRPRHPASQSQGFTRRGEVFRNHDLFLAQKIQVGVTAGTHIDDCRKVTGKIICPTVTVKQWKSKGELQRDLGCPDDFAVLPRLTVNSGCGFSMNRNRIQERLTI